MVRRVALLVSSLCRPVVWGVDVHDPGFPNRSGVIAATSELGLSERYHRGSYLCDRASVTSAVRGIIGGPVGPVLLTISEGSLSYFDAFEAAKTAHPDWTDAQCAQVADEAVRVPRKSSRWMLSIIERPWLRRNFSSNIKNGGKG
jgi:hypothetical protein